MSRFHVHLNVSDLDASIRFYSALFAATPTVRKHDYAKWQLDEPKVNFAISCTGAAPGIDHLGIQADDAQALAELGLRLDAAGGAVQPEAGAVCCYARSDKLWTEDPQGTRWETFHTVGDATTYHGQGEACASEGVACAPKPAQPVAATSACCGPKASACC